MKSLPLDSTVSIIRVRDRLPSVREKAYTPKTTTIGPFHHGKQEPFKEMEEKKTKYLYDFLGITNASEHAFRFIKIIKDKEKLSCICYTEPIDEFKSDEFVKMMLIGGSFIMNLLTTFSSYQGKNDCIFNILCMIQNIWPDLLLLENQLPFFFLLEDLYYLRKHKFFSTTTTTSARLSLINLLCHYVKGNEKDIEAN